MRKYKLINGQPTEIKIIYLENGGIISNPNEQILIEEGCKELIIEEQPIIKPWESVETTYSENDTQIIQGWEVVSNWHEASCSIQIKLTHYDNTRLLIDYPEFVNLPTQLGLPVFSEQDFLYIYAGFLLPEHEAILEQYGTITPKI